MTGTAVWTECGGEMLASGLMIATREEEVSSGTVIRGQIRRALTERRTQGVVPRSLAVLAESPQPSPY